MVGTASLVSRAIIAELHLGHCHCHCDCHWWLAVFEILDGVQN